MRIDFEKHFSKILLIRGYDYYLSDLVDDVKIKDNHVSATVLGTHDYNVSVDLKNGKLESAFCDCPYASGGDTCKHITALLYYLNNELDDINISKEKMINKEKSIIEIINNIDEKELKNFLINLLQNDKKQYDLFRRKFIGEFPIPSVSDYKKDIQRAIRDVAGRNGYIDYYAGYDYVSAMFNFTAEAEGFIQKEHYELAFNIACLILDEIPELSIDGSNGETGEVAEKCVEIIRNIIEECEDQKVIKKILKYINEEIITETLSNYAIELYVLIDIFIEKNLYLSEIEKMLLEAIEKGKENKYFYKQEIYVELLIDIYQRTNQNNKVIELIKDNLDDYNVRLKYVDLLIESKDYDQAIEQLKIGIKENVNEYRGVVIIFSNKLLSIYEKLKMSNEYKEELYQLFFNYDKYDFEIFKKIKKLYSPKEWSTEFAIILNKIDVNEKNHINSRIMQIYIEEKMVDEIFELVINCYNFDTIKNYEKHVLSKYKNELIEHYLVVIRNIARNVSNRGEYQKLASKLKYVKKLNKEKTKMLITELVDQYKNRPAMLDEFDKKGLL